MQADILNLLQRLNAEHKLTYVLVSHDLSVIAHMCDRMAVMNAGRVVEEMTVDQLHRAGVAQAYGNTWIVTKGLADGDRLIVEGLQKIAPQMRR